MDDYEKQLQSKPTDKEKEDYKLKLQFILAPMLEMPERLRAFNESIQQLIEDNANLRQSNHNLKQENLTLQRRLDNFRFNNKPNSERKTCVHGGYECKICENLMIIPKSLESQYYDSHGNKGTVNSLLCEHNVFREFCNTCTCKHGRNINKCNECFIEERDKNILLSTINLQCKCGHLESQHDDNNVCIFTICECINFIKLIPSSIKLTQIQHNRLLNTRKVLRKKLNKKKKK